MARDISARTDKENEFGDAESLRLVTNFLLQKKHKAGAYVLVLNGTNRLLCVVEVGEVVTVVFIRVSFGCLQKFPSS